MKSENLKSVVKEKYGEIAKKSLAELDNATCCGTQCCGNESHDFTAFNDDYTKLNGYNKNADLKLGCGIPTEVAAINTGDVVVDLGSGAGNDAFVARALVGNEGKVIGIDMTEPMIEKARKNAEILGFSNVEFRLGDIEQMPVDTSSVDVIISNCVLNLVPDKVKAFLEMFRILKSGGHFSVSDIVLARTLPIAIQEAAEMYAGCVSGAIHKSEYLKIIEQAGFRNVAVKIEKPIHLPLEVLAKYLSAAEAEKFINDGAAILSITVYGEKE
jgi:arsenite methyltransferase